MAIYFPDGNGGRRPVSLSEFKMTGFSQVAALTGAVTDDDTGLTAFAKIYNGSSGGQGEKTQIPLPTQGNTLTYDGSAQSPVWLNYSASKMTKLAHSENSATDAGTYTVYFSLQDGYEWEDGSLDDKAVTWTIERAAVNVPVQSGTLTYNGEVQSPTWLYFDEEKLTITGTQAGVHANDYTVRFTLKANYMWTDGTRSIKSVTWTINTAVIANIPVQSGTLTYNGEIQSPTWLYFDETKMSISGPKSGTKAGTYTVSFTPKPSCAWADGSTDGKTATWTIKPLAINALPAQVGTLTYNGNVQSPTWSNFDETQLAASGTQIYRNAGTYTVSFSPKSNYSWADGSTVSKEVKWEIKKATATISLSETSIRLYNPKATKTIDVTFNSDATPFNDIVCTVTSADPSLCTAQLTSLSNVSGTCKIVINPVGRGDTTITISAESTNHIISGATISVAVNQAPIDMLAGRTLAQLQTIFKNGQAAQYFKPGDYFNVTFSNEVALVNLYKIDAGSTYRAVLLGIDHNSGVEGTKRGHFCIGKTTDDIEMAFRAQRMNSTATNAGGWGSSEMKNWLNDNFYNALPADLRNVITSCVKYTDNVGNGSNTANTVTSTSQKIWLMAAYELYGESSPYANPYEEKKQAQYDYFKNTAPYRRAYQNGEASTLADCWLRTPRATDDESTNENEATTQFLCDNKGVKYEAASNINCFVPCFTIS